MAAMDALLKIKAAVEGEGAVGRLAGSIGNLGKAGKGAEGAMRGLGGSVAGLSGVMGALAPLLSVAGIMALGTKAIETGDKLFDMAQRTGTSVEALARFSKAAAMNGTDIDGVAKALGKLSKGMMDAATSGSGPAAEALRMLGISATDASGKLRGADDVMLDVADRFRSMPDGAQKTALALQLFGKSGAEMIPMLNQGSEAIGKLSVKMTAAFAAKADEYSDKMRALTGTVNSLGITVADVLLPTLISMTERLTGFAKQTVAYVESNKTAFEVILRGLNAFAYATGALITQSINQVAALGRVLGRLSMGDFGGAVQEAGAFITTFKNQAAKDFQELGRILNGTATSVKTTGQAAAGSLTAAQQAMLQLTNEQERAKEKQAQWKAWVDETEMSYKRMQFTISQTQQANAGQQQILDARVAAEAAINNAAKTMLQIKLNTAKTDGERLAITQQIAALDIASAEAQVELADVQQKTMLRELELKIQSAKVGQAQAAATLAEAQARGVVTDQYEKALQAQTQLVQQTVAELGIARQVAQWKVKGAQATYEAAVAQARASVEAARMKIQQDAIAKQSAAAANNIRQIPSSLDAAADSANRLAGGLKESVRAASQVGLGSGRIGLFGLTPNPSVQGFASGGYVQRPTAAVIGEGGESEYVIPSSRMASASAAYLAGARGSAVLSSTGATSTSSPQINITTGPVLEFDGQRYVRVEDLERAMRATAEGVIGRLRTPAARRALGVT